MRRRIATFGALALLLSAVPASAAPSLVLKPHLTFTGEATGDSAGHQVEIGDLNGDGVGDLIIGAWHNDAGGDDSGAVYIQYGPLTKGMSLAQAEVKLFTPLGGEYVGEGPLGVADLNGDGADDLVIGAPGSFYAAQPGSPGKIGEAFLIYGARKRLKGQLELPSTADVRFTGVHMTEWLGFGSSGVGDLDGDGREELLIGAPATAGFSGAGYLFYGAKKRLKGDVSVTAADAILVGGRAGEMFGYEAAGGDLDDDGDDDLFVASKPLAGGPATVSMFLGGDRITGLIPAAIAHSRFPVATVDYFSGPALASGTDVTGDGIDDLVAGVAPYLNPVPGATTYVINGSDVGFELGVQLSSHTTIEGAGSAVALGDVNGDRKADLVVGDTLTHGGVAYVFLGPIEEQQLITDAADAIFNGEADSEAGAAVAIGNLNRDRLPDVAIGAPANAGRTYVTFGGQI